MKFLAPLIAGKKRIYTRNVEEVVVQQLTPPYAKNKVCSYPAKVQVRVCGTVGYKTPRAPTVFERT